MAGNPNLKPLREAVKELGGEVVGSRTSGKHFLVTVKTKKGNVVRVTLSKGPMRQGHVLFWLRQKFRTADRNGNYRGNKRRIK
jgi:hypothetical protein